MEISAKKKLEDFEVVKLKDLDRSALQPLTVSSLEGSTLLEFSVSKRHTGLSPREGRAVNQDDLAHQGQRVFSNDSADPPSLSTDPFSIWPRTWWVLLVTVLPSWVF